jgi:hypothetical protein
MPHRTPKRPPAPEPRTLDLPFGSPGEDALRGHGQGLPPGRRPGYPATPTPPASPPYRPPGGRRRL